MTSCGIFVGFGGLVLCWLELVWPVNVVIVPSGGPVASSAVA